MYKILIKMDTYRPTMYDFYTIKNDKGEEIEYSANSLEEAKNMALYLINSIGYGYVRVIEDKPYYLNVEANPNCEPFTESELKEVLKALEVTGKNELLLSKSSDYNIVWNWGIRPERLIPTYDIYFRGSGVHFLDSERLGILKDSTIENVLTFDEPIKSFHLRIDSEEGTSEFNNGLPEWVQYVPMGVNKGKLILSGINKNYSITVILD